MKSAYAYATLMPSLTYQRNCAKFLAHSFEFANNPFVIFYIRGSLASGLLGW
jgi:hypothetical protein